VSDDTFIMTPITTPLAEPQEPYEQPPAPARPARAAHAAPAPVFVDATGRRRRRVRRLGLALAVLAVGYLVLAISTALGGPTLNEPFLPLPGTTEPAAAQPGPEDSPAGAGDATERSRSATGSGQPQGASGTRSTTGTPSSTAPAVSASPSAKHSPGAHATKSRASTAPGATHRPVK